MKNHEKYIIKYLLPICFIIFCITYFSNPYWTHHVVDRVKNGNYLQVEEFIFKLPMSCSLPRKKSKQIACMLDRSDVYSASVYSAPLEVWENFKNTCMVLDEIYPCETKMGITIYLLKKNNIMISISSNEIKMAEFFISNIQKQYK